MGKDLKGKELGVGISQRSDGTYSARFTDRFGKRQQKYFKKLADCKKWIAEATFIDEHTDINQAANVTVDSWYEYWIGLKSKSVRHYTIRNYNDRYYNNIKEVIGHKLLSEVTTMDCQNILNIMSDEGYKTSSIVKTRTILKEIFEMAKDNDILLANPCKKSVNAYIGLQSDERNAMTIDEQSIFLKSIVGNKYEYEYRFLLQTGLRYGELAGLRWQDVDFKRKMITINNNLTYNSKSSSWILGEPKSRSGHRTIPLTQEAVRILKLQKNKTDKILNRNNAVNIGNRSSEFVFISENCKHIFNSLFNKDLIMVCSKSGIRKISLHILRHTFATRCAESGMKPKTLQTILGHSNIGITMNLYVHTTDDEKIKEISLIESALKIV